MAKISALPVTNLLQGEEILPLLQGGATRRTTMAALVAYLSAFFGRGPKGDPGGDMSAIGLFTEANGMDIPAGVKTVRTTGWASLGEGAALYVLDELSAYAPDQTSQVAEPNDLTGPLWAGATTASFDGTWTTITDTGAGYQRWETQLPGFVPDIATLEVEVAKDDVPATTRKAIVRLRFDGGVPTQYDLYLDTQTGAVTPGSAHAAASSLPYDYHTVDLGDRYRIVVSGLAPINSTVTSARLYPANGPGNVAVSAAMGSIRVRGVKLYAGTSDLYVPFVDERTSFTASDGRVFGLSTQQVARPQMWGFRAAAADNTDAMQAFTDAITRTVFPSADCTANGNISAPIVWGPNVATETLTGRLRLRALAPMTQMIDWRGQRDVKAGLTVELYGYGSSEWEARGCLFGETFNDCRGMDWTGGGAYYSTFRYAGCGVYSGNNSFIRFAKRSGFYCGSGAASAGLSLTATWANPVHKGDPDTADQYTEVDVSVIPEDAMLMGTGSSRKSWKVWINGSPRLVLGVTRADGYDGSAPSPGKLRLFPWVDLRIQGTATLDYMFGGGVYLAGADSNEQSGDFEFQLSGAALVTDALYGGKFKLSAQSAGMVLGAGLRQYGVHQPDEIELIYNENCRANVVMANGQNGDFGRVHIGGQHQEPSADSNWTFLPLHDTAIYRPSAISGWEGSTVMHNHRRCQYEKPNPENYRRPVDLSASANSRRANALAIDPNRESAYYAECEVTSRDVYLRKLSTGLRRNMGYSGARYEARGTGPNGAPTGTIYFTAEGDVPINGQPGPAMFSGFKRIALFSIEWDRLTGGWLIHLLNADNSTQGVSFFCGGAPAAGEVIASSIMPYAMTIGSGILRSLVSAGAATTFTIRRNGATIGTATFAPASTVANAVFTSTALAAGDLVTITAPNAADPQLSDIAGLIQ